MTKYVYISIMVSRWNKAVFKKQVEVPCRVKYIHQNYISATMIDKFVLNPFKWKFEVFVKNLPDKEYLLSVINKEPNNS